MVAIVDYGVGNLFSLRSSFAAIGQQAVATADPDLLAKADRLVLPGVGAFGDAAAALRQSGLDKAVLEAAEAGKPLLGICLGMQLLLEKSYEYGEHKGLGLIPGEVRPIREVIPEGLKVPHIGWNALALTREGRACGLFKNTKEGDCVYFVHSYWAASPAPYVLAAAEYGAPLTAAVGRGNVLGVQFHPEKSGSVGLAILRAFCETEVGG